MAILLNRKYSSRIECLYYVLKTALNNYEDSSFAISDIRFSDTAKDNVFNHCALLKSRFEIQYCPFLDNPLNSSKCYITQSTNYDSTKAKAASSVVRAWEALGFVEAKEREFIFTKRGKQFASLRFEDPLWFEIMKQSVLSYGPIIGYLESAFKMKELFNSSELYVSYPKTNDPIELSTFSTRDSNTRTVSLLTSWCLQAGLIEPVNLPNEQNTLAHLFYRDIVNAKRLTIREFKVTPFVKEYFSSNPYVSNTLSYPNLNKNVGSLRERNSEHIRNVTQEYNSIILNRRFAIIYMINSFNEKISFNKFVKLFEKYYAFFFLPSSDVRNILQSELSICSLAGLLLNIDFVNGDIIIKNLSNVNNDILSTGAPVEIVELANKMVTEL